MIEDSLRPVPIEQILVAADEVAGQHDVFTPHVFLVDSRVIALDQCDSLDDAQEAIDEFLELYRAMGGVFNP